MGTALHENVVPIQEARVEQVLRVQDMAQQVPIEASGVVCLVMVVVVVRSRVIVQGVRHREGVVRVMLVAGVVRKNEVVALDLVIVRHGAVPPE
jgi:hypothetical protein